MRTASLLSAALLVVCSSCISSPNRINDHWSAHSVSARVGRAFLGYDANIHGDSYKDFQWQKKQHVNAGILRHFLNHNPENPFQEGEGLAKTRPYPHSPLPNPLPYIHLEGLVLGAVLFYPPGSAGVLIPFPIDSILGTIEDEEGVDEFWNGIAETLTPIGVVSVSLIDNTVGKEGPLFTNTYGSRGAAAIVTPLYQE